MKNVLSCILIFLFVMPCAGQRVLKTYQGPFSKGKITYSYYLNSKEERVWHGDCVYAEGRNTARGSFVDSKKNGRWTFYESIDGVMQTVIVDFDKGKINGLYKDNKHTLTFTEGKLIGTKTIDGVACSFDNDGNPDGTWSYSFQGDNGIPFTVTNEFKHGVWITGVLTDESTGTRRVYKPEYGVSPELFFANYNYRATTAVIEGKTYKLKRGLKWNTTYDINERTPLPSLLNDLVKHNFFNGGEYQFAGVPRAEITTFDNNSRTKNSQTNTNNDNRIYDIVDTPPSFPGGMAALQAYLRNNIIYPEVAANNGIEGRVIVQFIVGKDGSLSNVTVARSADVSLDKEAVRVVKSMPKWIHGKHAGVAVNVKYTCPVIFRLQ